MFYADYSMGSAPAIRSNDSTSLCAALDALLVNGFGSYTAPGWTIEYTATSKRVYRPAAGNRFYLRVDESTSTLYGRIRGYESMSDIDNGTNPFPTVAQVTGSSTGAGNLLGIQKGNSSTATARNWYFFGDEKCFYLLIDGVGAGNTALTPCFFGDFIPYASGYSYNTAIGGIHTTDTSAYYSFVGNCVRPITYSSLSDSASVSNSNLFIARSVTGSTLSMVGMLTSMCAKNASGASYLGVNAASPTNALVNTDTNKVYMNKVTIASAAYAEPLGYMPGLWEPVCGRAYTNVTPLDTAKDNAYNTNNTFVFISGQYSGIYALERFTTGNWA